MQLIYKNEHFALQRDASAMKTVLKKVSELIEEKDTVFSHLVIDGVELYENHEQYIEERLSTINRIEIITYKTKEMIWETLQSIDAYFKRAIPALNEMIDDSYDGFTDETWAAISQLTEALEWMFQFKTFTESASEQPNDWSTFVEVFTACEEQFEPLLKSIEAQDTDSISHLLASEIVPAFHQLADNVSMMLSDTSYIKDIH